VSLEPTGCGRFLLRPRRHPPLRRFFRRRRLRRTMGLGHRWQVCQGQHSQGVGPLGQRACGGPRIFSSGSIRLVQDSSVNSRSATSRPWASQDLAVAEPILLVANNAPNDAAALRILPCGRWNVLDPLAGEIGRQSLYHRVALEQVRPNAGPRGRAGRHRNQGSQGTAHQPLTGSALRPGVPARWRAAHPGPLCRCRRGGGGRWR